MPRRQILHHYRRHATVSHLALHDDATGDKQITSEGYAFFPTLSPDGKKYYCFALVTGSHFLLQAAELWVSDVATGAAGTEFCFRD